MGRPELSGHQNYGRILLAATTFGPRLRSEGPETKARGPENCDHFILMTCAYRNSPQAFVLSTRKFLFSLSVFS
jgi:hypothetical protein